MSSKDSENNSFFSGTRNRLVIFSILAAAVAGLMLSSAGSFLGWQHKASAQESSGPTTTGPDTMNTTAQPQGEPVSPIVAAVDMNATKLVISGSAASPGDEAGPFQLITILPERTDGKIYSGLISFTASAPIYVVPGYGFDSKNSTLDHMKYGELIRFPAEASFANNSNAVPEIAHGPIMPQYSPSIDSGIGALPKVYTASVPFSGDVLEVGDVNGTNFLISYTVIADVYNTVRVSDMGAAIMNTTGHPQVENQVSITNGAVEKTTDAFSPSPISIMRGENVTWTNNDFLPHTVTSGTPDQAGAGKVGTEFDSGFIGTKSSFTHTFENKGDFDYFCQLHPNMVGKVTVN
jgi:plastocyanin